jgi:hypothetical protein
VSTGQSSRISVKVEVEEQAVLVNMAELHVMLLLLEEEEPITQVICLYMAQEILPTTTLQAEQSILDQVALVEPKHLH